MSDGMDPETRGHIREIRNWVRFIGILIVAGMVVGACVGIMAGAGMASAF